MVKAKKAGAALSKKAKSEVKMTGAAKAGASIVTLKKGQKLQFVVRGAVVECGSGSSTTTFSPPDRGITAGNGLVGTEYDTSPGHFAGTFGLCKITDEPCTMSFVPKWFNPSPGVKYRVDHLALDLSLPDTDDSKAVQPATEALLTMKSSLVCTKGDKVTFVTDGQEFEDAENANHNPSMGGSDNPHDDPWKAEALAWEEVLNSNMTQEEKLQKLSEFYGFELEGDMLDQLEALYGELTDSNSFYVPSVQFNDKTRLGEQTMTLPDAWLEHIKYLCDTLNIDYDLAIAFIMHESGGDPNKLNTMYKNPQEQATGLYQIIPKWHYAFQEGGQYYNNNPDVFEYSIERGADINNLYDPLGNITVGVVMLYEKNKLSGGDMQKLVGSQGEGPNANSTYEILWYRDQLAQQHGGDPWYSDEWYTKKGMQ